MDKKVPTWSCFFLDTLDDASLCDYIDGYDIGEVLVKFYAEEHHRRGSRYPLVAVIPGRQEDALGFWGESCVLYKDLPEILKYLEQRRI